MNQHELREKIGYVPQKGLLFSGTIATNLRYGDAEASDQTLQESAEVAQATEFISALETDLILRSARVVPTYRAVSARDFPSQERWLRKHQSISLTTPSPHWTLRPMRS